MSITGEDKLLLFVALPVVCLGQGNLLLLLLAFAIMFYGHNWLESRRESLGG